MPVSCREFNRRRDLQLSSRSLVSTVALCSILAGCGGQGVPVPSDRFHRLHVGGPATVYETPRLGGTVEVGRFDADGVLQGREIVFVEHENPNVMHQYQYQLWADPPTRMLQAATVDYLRDARVADQIVTAGLRVEPSYTLTADIKKLEHVIGNSSSVLVELEYSLRDYRRGDLVWVKTYKVAKPVGDSSVSAATEAMSQAVDEILSNLTTDLAGR